MSDKVNITNGMPSEIYQAMMRGDSDDAVVWCQNRIAELEAVVSKMPTTADKKPVVPGDVVYYTYGTLVALPMVIPHFSEWFFLEHSEGVKVLAEGEFMHEGKLTPISHYVDNCWSTEAAALAAREEENK